MLTTVERQNTVVFV